MFMLLLILNEEVLGMLTTILGLYEKIKHQVPKFQEFIKN